MPTIRTAAGKGGELTPTEADSNMKRTAVAKSSNYTLDATHNREVHELGGTVATVTAPSVSSSFTETDDWEVLLINTLSTNVTIARNSQTINGASADYVIPPGGRVRLIMNSSYNGFWAEGYGFDVSFSAYRSTDRATPGAATWQTVNFDTEVFDTVGSYNTNGTWTCVVPGKYHFSASIYIESLPSGSGAVGRFYHNATTEYRVGYTKNHGASASDEQMTLDLTIDMAVGDTLTCDWQFASGSGANVGGSTTRLTQFTGFRTSE